MSTLTTAVYKIMSDTGGNRYRFYCALSGALACTTTPTYAQTPEEELRLAWEAVGRRHFNLCHKCRRWVIDAVYNADVFACVDCAPYEAEPKYCKHCGAKIKAPAGNCPACGLQLM